MSFVPLQPEVLNPDARSGLIILCDHASNVVPDHLDNLGLKDVHLDDHIAWDIGAADITRTLCDMMGASAVLAPVSRLVVDCNRDPSCHTLVPPVSDGIEIPGNVNMTAEELAARKAAYYDTFHKASADLVSAHIKAGKVPLVVGMHSFTPTMAGKNRPWHIGFLWNRDPRLAQALIGLVERETDLVVGDNLPYSGKDLYYTMDRHGSAHGLPQTTIEIRQDLVRKDREVREWAALLADLLDECMTRADLTQPRHY